MTSLDGNRLHYGEIQVFGTFSITRRFMPSRSSPSSAD